MPNNPSQELHRALAAQRALGRQQASIPDISAALVPASTRIWQEVQRVMAAQGGLATVLGSAAAAIRQAELHGFASIATRLGGAEIALRQVQQTVADTSMLRDVVSGRILGNLAQTLGVAASISSQLGPAFQSVNVAQSVMRDYATFIRGVAEAGNRISEQLRTVEEIVGSGAAAHAAVRAAGLRLDTLRLADLQSLLRDVTERTAEGEPEFPWPEDAGAQLARETTAELEQFSTVEEKLNYLIQWTQRQDRGWKRQAMLSLVINPIAALIFWLSVEVIPRSIHFESISKPSVRVREIRMLAEQQELSSEDHLQLRIVRRSTAPVRKSWRRGAPRIAVLHAGSLVRVVAKRGKWVHIEWTDFPSGRPLQGWLLSKQLTPLKRHTPRSIAGRR